MLLYKQPFILSTFAVSLWYFHLAFNCSVQLNLSSVLKVLQTPMVLPIRVLKHSEFIYLPCYVYHIAVHNGNF